MTPSARAVPTHASWLHNCSSPRRESSRLLLQPGRDRTYGQRLHHHESLLSRDLSAGGSIFDTQISAANNENHTAPIQGGIFQLDNTRHEKNPNAVHRRPSADFYCRCSIFNNSHFRCVRSPVCMRSRSNTGSYTETIRAWQSSDTLRDLSSAVRKRVCSPVERSLTTGAEVVAVGANGPRFCGGAGREEAGGNAVARSPACARSRFTKQVGSVVSQESV